MSSPIQSWFSINESEHNAEWANRIIRWVRMQMQPLVSPANAALGMNYMLSKQDMTAIMNLFQNPAKLNLTNRPVDPIVARAFTDDPEGRKAGTEQLLQDEMLGLEFPSLPILEKTRNILIAEMKKMGIIITVQANDPTSTEDRKRDEGLLKHRKEIEGFLSYIYTSIGQRPFKMEDHEHRFGEKAESGNLGDFAAMGLNDQDMDDIAFFMSNFYKLDWEIDIQKILDAVMSYNEVLSKNIEMWAMDILAKKAIAAQAYVSDTTGAIQYNYLTPETTYIYTGGRRKDFNDSNAKAYQQLITVKEFMERAGNSFDYEAHLEKIIQAVFTASNGSIDITGINPDLRGYGTADWYCRGRDNTTYSYNQFMQFKVLFGYMEWVSQNETAYGKQLKEKGKNFDNGKGKENEGTFFEDNQNPDGKKYQTKSRYETPTYKAYYLAITAVDHIMFDFGRMTYQDIKGYNDIASNFSIITYKEVGDPIAISCIPYIDLINECWYKWKYEIRKAKPRGTNYNYDSLMTIAQNLYADTDMSEHEKFEKIISWRNKSANGVWTFPMGPDGKPIMLTTAQLDFDMANGLTPEVMKYWEIMVSTRNEMIDLIMGTSDLRQGDSPGDRSSMNNEFRALESSQESTAYLPDMITFMCRQLAVRTSLFAQDIVQFKDYDTLAYKWLLDIAGQEALDTIEDMDKTALNRYGIFVESLNQSAQRNKLSARIDFAIQNGKISNAQALLVEDIKSPKLAFLTLAYFEQRTEKLKQKQQQDLAAQQQQNAMQLAQQQQKLEAIKGDYMLQGKKIDQDTQIQAHIITQKGQLTKQELKTQADSRQIFEQATADLQKEQASLNQSGSTTPAPLPQQPMQPQGPPPQQATPAGSGIAQQIAATQPQPIGQ